jgi:nicotinate-nucleotide adenylyltransferase
VGVSGGAPGQPRAARAIGILGGTFDPVHDGHLALAHEALDELDLDHVLFVPNADPPHKRGQVVTPSQHRAAMVALAIEPEPAFLLSRIELDRPGPSYAVDTVEQLARVSAAEGRSEPWFILSAEVLEGLHAWREPERVLQLCRIAVAPRPGAEPLGYDWVAQHFPGHEERFAFLPGPELDIASTTIRERVAHGKSIEGQVPTSVAWYIEEHGLYAARSSAAGAR